MTQDLKILEKLETWIPGFRGYKQKELLREDDRLVRNYLYRRLKDAEGVVKTYMPDAFDGKLPLNASELQGMAKDLDSLGTRIRAAPGGYGGYFDRVKVEEAELTKLKQLDAALVPACDGILALARELRKNAALMSDLREKIDALGFDIDARNEMFKSSRGG